MYIFCVSSLYSLLNRWASRIRVKVKLQQSFIRYTLPLIYREINIIMINQHMLFVYGRLWFQLIIPGATLQSKTVDDNDDGIHADVPLEESETLSDIDDNEVLNSPFANFSICQHLGSWETLIRHFNKFSNNSVQSALFFGNIVFPGIGRHVHILLMF